MESMSLQKIKILLEDHNLRVSNKAEVDEAWKSLDCTLHTLPNLSVVEVVVSPREWERHAEMVREVLPKCKEQGRLVVRSSVPERW